MRLDYARTFGTTVVLCVGLSLSGASFAQDTDASVEDQGVAVVEPPTDPRDGDEEYERAKALLAAVDGIHGFFIGRGDLTVALGAKSSADASVKDAVNRIVAAAKKAAKPVCVMVAGAAEAAEFAGLGASAFIISSDQGQMRRAAAQTLGEFRSLVQTTDGSHVSQH